MTVDVLSEWRRRLLAYKPKTTISEDDLRLFVSCFKQLRNVLADSEVKDKERVQSVDVMSMLMLRIYQVIRKNEDQENLGEFVDEIKKSAFSLGEFEFLFHYVIDFWTVNTVSMEVPLRNLFDKLLQLLNALYGTQMLQKVLNTWVVTVLLLEETMKVQYYLIDVFSGHIDLYELLTLKPGFVESCLKLVWAENLCTQVGKCLSNVLLNWYRHHYDEESMDEWLTQWKPLCCAYLNDPKYTKNIQLYVLLNVFRELPCCFGRFIESRELFSSTVLLHLLKIGQELSIEEEPFHENKYISMEDLSLLLQQEQFKLSAFQLLTYSNKKAKMIPMYVFDILRESIPLFFVDTKLQTRNYFHSSLKHFINRIRDSTYSLDRDAKKLEAKNKFPEEQEYKRAQISNAQSFSVWLVCFLKTQMTPGSQYPRKSLAYKIYTTLLISGLDLTVPEQYLDTKHRMTYPYNVALFDDTAIRLFVDDLTNDYDDIRQYALSLLTIGFKTERKTSFIIDDESLFNLSLSMLSSYKLSDGGAKILEFVFSVSGRNAENLNTLLNTLDDLLQKASVDLIKNISVPVSGIFTAFALVLKYVKTTDDDDHTIDHLINASVKNWETVKRIVCHDSPEGNLPLEYLNCGVSDQVITSYAFRSIKESSSMLSSILDEETLNLSQLGQCGSLILDQLSYIRHTGAFQSVFPTYVKLCARCQQEQPVLLQQWLQSSVTSLKTKSQYITRRSGGLPFMISAIVASENSAERPWLKWTFDQLFAIATVPVLKHEEKLDLPQVHAFNCMKGLFNEPKLSPYLSSFVEPTLRLCLDNFTSSAWSMRNCSVMLFTALQNRLFGKVGKPMSARLFFTRFKGLRELLSESLQVSIEGALSPLQYSNEPDANASSASNCSIESIFLIFTILGRLKPTLGYDGLQQFEIQIEKALGCPNWKIRELAARTLALLTTNAVLTCENILSKVLHCACSEDMKHGVLLATKELLSASSDICDESGVSDILCLLLKNHTLFLRTSTCYATAKLYVEILGLLLTRGSVTEKERQSILTILGNLFITECSSYSVDGSKQLFLAVLTKTLLMNEKDDAVPDVAELALWSGFFEAQLTAIGFLEDIDVSNAQFRAVREVLLDMLYDPHQWSQTKAKILRVLNRSNIRLDFERLQQFSLEKSETFQCSLIENIEVFENVPDTKFWDLVETHSRDYSPEQVRLSVARCLMTKYSRSPSFKVAFRIYQLLYDDSSVVRETAATFLKNNFISFKVSEDVKLSPYAISLKCVDTLSSTCKTDADLKLVLDLFQALSGALSSQDFTAYVKDELFDLEEDNLYRNEKELGCQLIQILKSCRNGIVQSQIEKIDKNLTQVLFSLSPETFDGFLKWGSQPHIFGKIFLQRKLLTSFDRDTAVLDNKLKSLNCHPILTSL